MGLTSWSGSKVRKNHVSVAKNHLNKNEIKELNRIVTMYLDYAEDQAERNNPLYMKDWEEKLNKFLQFNEREILTNAGKVRKKVAKEIAQDEYEKFNKKRIENESKKRMILINFLKKMII